MTCEATGIERRLTKPSHPWSEEDRAAVRWAAAPANGQVERASRAIEGATTKRCRRGGREQLRRQLELLLDAGNHPRRLGALEGLAPARFARRERQPRPGSFPQEPCHSMAGPNS